MRLSPSPQPFNRDSSRTLWIGSTAALFLLAATATLTVWIRDPFVSWGYEVSAFILGGWCCLKASPRGGVTNLGLAGIAMWGFAQLALSATVYRYATLEASLRLAALAATAMVASSALERVRLQTLFLRSFAVFGFAVAIWAVLAYYTAAGKILWIFPSGYPDVWGPFPSRNNFAEFLELTLPVALWLAVIEDRLLYKVMAAAMLAAGLASASRAGAALLIFETIVALGLLRGRGTLRGRTFWQIMAAGTVFVAVAGAGQLVGRMRLSQPFEYRDQMARSTWTMIAEHPWRGFGLGTFATVYPAYATFDTGAVVDHAHNDWLEWASEGGLAFAGLWAVLALATFRPAIRTVWGLGVPTIFLHAIVDYPFARFGLTAWIFILIGALGSADKGKSGAERIGEIQNGTVLIGGGDGVESKLRHGRPAGDRNCGC